MNNANPETKEISAAKNRKETWWGIVAAVIILFGLGAIAAPNFIQSRHRAQANSCACNLRLIDAAKEQWALETGQAMGATVITTAVDGYCKGNTTPICPGGGHYTYGRVGTKPACSIPAHSGIY